MAGEAGAGGGGEGGRGAEGGGGGGGRRAGRREGEARQALGVQSRAGGTRARAMATATPGCAQVLLAFVPAEPGL